MNRIAFRVFVALLLAAAVALGAAQAVIIGTWESCASQPIPSVQTAVVLGYQLDGDSLAPVLTKRLDVARLLYHAGKIKTVILTGGVGNTATTSEADAMRTYLLRSGIPPEAIRIEDGSHSTEENLTNVLPLMTRLGSRECVLITSAPHLCRALLLAKEQGIEAFGVPAELPEDLYTVLLFNLREDAALVGYGLMRTFAYLGRQ